MRTRIPVTLPVALGLALQGCVSFNNLPSTDYGYLDGPLVDARGGVATAEGLFLPLSHAGDVAVLGPDAEAAELVVLDPIDGDRLAASPDGETVLALGTGLVCDADEAPRSDDLADCGGELIERSFVDVIAPADATARFAVPRGYDAFVFSPDGRFAVAPLDPTVSSLGSGVSSLASVLVLDLVQSEQWEVPVGFAADRLLFTTDGSGVVDGMVVLSQSEVVIVDLSGAVPVPGSSYPLTLDADSVVVPSGVALTPAGDYALITVDGSADLYALDLVDPSINIVSLAGIPSAMVVDDAHDRTIITYRNRAAVDLLDHVYFDLETIDLDEPATDVILSEDYALLWNRNGQRDAIRLDLETLRADEYRLNFAPSRMDVAPDGSFALAFSGAGNGARMEVLDLVAVDGDVDDDPKPFGLDGAAVGVTFAEADQAETRALLLLDGVDTLYELSWPSLQVEAVDLPSPPVAIGAIPDGPFWITHTDALGLVSFYEPGGQVRSVGGFGLNGIDDEPRLYLGEEE